MFLEALHSIRDDFSRSVFYWLTFVITSMFIFLFFNLSYSEAIGFTFINSKNNMTTFVTVLNATICMVVIFFANDFYVKKKAKDLAIRLICGSTYFQLVAFLLFQTGLLLVLAIPIGIILAIIGLPFLNLFLSAYLDTSIVIGISQGALISTVVILFVVIFWCTFLNLGYAYRNSIYSLLFDDRMINTKIFIPMLYSFKVNKKFLDIMSILLYLLPVVGIYYYGNDPKSMLGISVLGMIGFTLFLNRIVIPYLEYSTHYSKTNQPVKLVYYGFIRTDIKLLKKNVILLILSSIFLSGILVACYDNPTEMVLTLLSFVVMNILLSLSIMFKLSSEMVGRKKLYQSLARTGYTTSLLKKICRNEVMGFYLFIIISSLVYIANIFISLTINSIISYQLCIILIMVFVIPLIICMMINYIYYYKTLF